MALLVLTVASGFVSAFLADLGPLDRTVGPILAVIGAAITLILLLLSVPLVITGIGLLRYREWARVLTIILSVINIINVPVGTALGIYGLWVLLSPETEPLFAQPPERKHRNALH